MYPDNRRRKKRALTFIEINIVVVLLAVIGLAIYSSLSAGSRIWRRGTGAAAEIDAAIFLDKLSSDLRNCLVYRAIPIDGGPLQCSFGVMASIIADEPMAGFGQVTYTYDTSLRMLSRGYQDYLWQRQGKAQKPASLLMQGIDSCRFRYFYADPQTGQAAWSDTIAAGELAAVQVELIWHRDRRQLRLVKIINLPLNAW